MVVIATTLGRRSWARKPASSPSSGQLQSIHDATRCPACSQILQYPKLDTCFGASRSLHACIPANLDRRLFCFLSTGAIQPQDLRRKLARLQPVMSGSGDTPSAPATGAQQTSLDATFTETPALNAAFQAGLAGVGHGACKEYIGKRHC